MLDVTLATVGLLAVAVGATSKLLRQLPISPPLLALLAGVIIGPAVWETVEIVASDRPAAMLTASRLLLAVAFMAVALRYPVTDLRPHGRPIALLLLVIMPVMALAVVATTGLSLGVSLATAAALGAALAPTDPVLASSVVTGHPAEREIPPKLRQVLSVESAANDGLALPFVLAAAALVVGGSVGGRLGWGLLEVAWGVVLGGILGRAAGKLLRTAEERREIDATSVTLFALMVAIAVLGVVALLGGDEILAVFVAGLAFSHTITASERIPEAEIDEGLNQFLVLPMFVLLGVVLPWEGWLELGWAGVLFAIAVVLLRRLPWVLLLHRPLGIGVRDAVWLGWFGPIGVNTIFYLNFLHVQGVTDPMVWHAGSLAVVASTVAHGVTSAPGRRLYARAVGRPIHDREAEKGRASE